MKKRICEELRILSWILWGLGFIIGCFVFFGNFYRYNTVTDWGFLMKVILRMFLIPASVHGLIVWLSKKEKPVFVVLGIIVLIPCLLLNGAKRRIKNYKLQIHNCGISFGND